MSLLEISKQTTLIFLFEIEKLFMLLSTADKITRFNHNIVTPTLTKGLIKICYFSVTYFENFN